MSIEERLAEIRGRCEAVEHASPITDLNRALDALWKFRHDIPYLLAEVERLTAERDVLNGLPIGTEIQRLPSGRWGIWVADSCVYETGDTLAEAVARVKGDSTVSSVSPQRAQLEAAVVEAALALRRAELRCEPVSGEPGTYEENEKTRHTSWGWFTAACDALLAFLGGGRRCQVTPRSTSSPACGR